MVVIKHIAPSVEDYLKLRLDAGLSAKSTEAAKRGLPNACFNVTLYYESSLIGMGRIVGDEEQHFKLSILLFIQIIKDKDMVVQLWNTLCNTFMKMR